MRRKALKIMLVSSILCSLAACEKKDDKSTDKEQNTVKEKETTVETDETTEAPVVTSDEIYSAAINAYTEAYKSNFEKIDGKYIEDGKSQLVYIGDDEKLCYAFADIDGNGTDEFFIASEKEGNNTIYDVWGYNGAEVVNIFSDYVFGFKNMCYVCDEGVLEITWKDGDDHTGIDYYKLAQDGYTAELIESLTTKILDNSVRYYHQNEEITEDEYNDIIAIHRSVELNWNYIEK